MNNNRALGQRTILVVLLRFELQTLTLRNKPVHARLTVL